MSSATQQLRTVATGAKPPADFKSLKPKDQVAHLLEAKKGEIAKMLPKHLNAERLLKVAQIAATTTPALLECELPSLISAIGQCAQMGLEPNTVLGHAYLIPFSKSKKDGNSWKTSKTVQVVIGYKGFIDLARRSGQIVSIAAHEVCKNDEFELCYGLDERLYHKPSMTDRGEVVGYYAVAKLKDGGNAFEFMRIQQIEEIRDRKDSNAWKWVYVSGKKTDKREKVPSPWWEHPVEMGRKTVIRRLAKCLPLSIEFQTAVALDNMAEGGKDQNLDIEAEYNILPDDAPIVHEDIDTDTGEIQQETQAIEHTQGETLEQDIKPAVSKDEPPLDAYAELDREAAQQQNQPRQRRERTNTVVD